MPDDVRRAWLQVARRDLVRLVVHRAKGVGGGNSFLGEPESHRQSIDVLDQT